MQVHKEEFNLGEKHIKSVFHFFSHDYKANKCVQHYIIVKNETKNHKMTMQPSKKAGSVKTKTNQKPCILCILDLLWNSWA